ncbi:MAG: cupin domain-containing protein [Holophagae bacterium]|nr:cupin domain-containing protein [Holophagae bacterium]
MGNLYDLKETMARGIADSLTSRTIPLAVPLAFDKEKAWKPTHLFQGSTGILSYLSCHASSLAGGHCPHPPHRHDDDEILLMLEGEADLVFPDESSPGGVRRHRLSPSQLVYYPAGFAHTIEAVGKKPANYLMISWNAPEGDFGVPMAFHEIDLPGSENAQKKNDEFRTVRFLEGPTKCLRKLQGHLSFLPPGSGYEPHADSHDVVLIVLAGEVETLGSRVGPFAAVFYRAGELHGMHNPGEQEARYLVFEFHSTAVPIVESWPIRMLIRVIRVLVPGRVRRRIRRFLTRREQRSGDRK